MTIYFDKCFSDLLKHEGDPGLVDNPKDPGGLTKYGVSKRAFPSVDVAKLTKAQAKEIYRSKYWQAAKCDQMPEGVAAIVFDCAVNHGIKQASLFVQRAAGATADGIIGQKTLTAIRLKVPATLISEIAVQRQLFFVSLKTFSTFGRGWTRRNIEVTATAIMDIKK